MVVVLPPFSAPPKVVFKMYREWPGDVVFFNVAQVFLIVDHAFAQGHYFGFPAGIGFCPAVIFDVHGLDV